MSTLCAASNDGILGSILVSANLPGDDVRHVRGPSAPKTTREPVFSCRRGSVHKGKGAGYVLERAALGGDAEAELDRGGDEHEDRAESIAGE